MWPRWFHGLCHVGICHSTGGISGALTTTRRHIWNNRNNTPKGSGVVFYRRKLLPLNPEGTEKRLSPPLRSERRRLNKKNWESSLWLYTYCSVNIYLLGSAWALRPLCFDPVCSPLINTVLPVEMDSGI